MKTATGLALIAVGAIFAFAVSAQAPGASLQAVGRSSSAKSRRRDPA